MLWGSVLGPLFLLLTSSSGARSNTTLALMSLRSQTASPGHSHGTPELCFQLPIRHLHLFVTQVPKQHTFNPEFIHCSISQSSGSHQKSRSGCREQKASIYSIPGNYLDFFQCAFPSVLCFLHLIIPWVLQFYFLNSSPHWFFPACWLHWASSGFHWLYLDSDICFHVSRYCVILIF